MPFAVSPAKLLPSILQKDKNSLMFKLIEKNEHVCLYYYFRLFSPTDTKEYYYNSYYLALVYTLLLTR